MIHKVSFKWCCLTAVFMVTVAFFLLARAFPTFPGDRGALQGVQDNQSGWLDTAALAVTSLGGWAAAVVLMAGMILYFALCRRRIDALIVLISGAPVLAGFLIKEVVGRARPDLLTAGSAPSTMSFPSGHSLFAMVFGGLLIVLVGELVTSTPVRWALQFGLALLIFGRRSLPSLLGGSLAQRCSRRLSFRWNGVTGADLYKKFYVGPKGHSLIGLTFLEKPLSRLGPHINHRRYREESPRVTHEPYGVNG